MVRQGRLGPPVGNLSATRSSNKWRLLLWQELGSLQVDGDPYPQQDRLPENRDATWYLRLP